MSNFLNMDLTCDLTVPTATVSFNAIALFVRPDVMRAKISSSRLVSASCIVRTAMRWLPRTPRGRPNPRLRFFDLQAELQQGLPSIAEQHRRLWVHEQIVLHA
ncbi:MAG: hypothetical protein JWO52_4147, partial [Gammaproteobacteria bacterium]|nr:hypothetical protein [Gammaproteobacteria bacterium]